MIQLFKSPRAEFVSNKMKFFAINILQIYIKFFRLLLKNILNLHHQFCCLIFLQYPISPKNLNASFCELHAATLETFFPGQTPCGRDKNKQMQNVCLESINGREKFRGPKKRISSSLGTDEKGM